MEGGEWRQDGWAEGEEWRVVVKTNLGAGPLVLYIQSFVMYMYIINVYNVAYSAQSA